MSKNDELFYKTHVGKYLHNFKSNDSNQQQCFDCALNLDFLIKIKNAFFALYPKLNEINVMKTKIPLFWGTNESDDGNLVFAFEPEVVITDQNNEIFSFKFIEYGLTNAEQIFLILTW